MLRYDTSLLDRGQNFNRAGAVAQGIKGTLGNVIGLAQQKKKTDLRNKAFAGYDPTQDTSGAEYTRRDKDYQNQLAQNWRSAWSQEGYQGLQDIQKQEAEAKQQKVKDEFDTLALDNERLNNRMNVIKYDNFKNDEIDKTLMYMSESPERYAAGMSDLQKYFPQDVESMGLPAEFSKDAQAKIVMRRGVSEKIKAINDAKMQELEAQQDRALERKKKEHDMTVKEREIALRGKAHNLDVKKYELEWLKDDRAAKAAEEAAKEPKDSTEELKRTFDQSKKLRDEYMKHTSEYRDVTDAMDRIKASAEEDTAAGDLSLVIAYMKMLDPGSVVREGEQIMVRKTGSIPDEVFNSYMKAKDGRFINQKLKAQFVSASENIYRRSTKTFEGMTDKYSTLATKFKLDPEDVIGNQGKDEGKDPLGLGL